MRRHLVSTVVGVLLMLSALVVGFVVTHRDVHSDGEWGVDHALSEHRDGALNVVSRIVDQGDGPLFAPILLAIACLVLFFGLRRRVTAIEFGAMVAVGWVAAALPKLLFPRVRPDASVAPLYPETKPDSFPSGHVAFVAAVTTAAAVLLWRAGRRRATAVVIAVGVVITALVAVMRLYAGVHWPADVVAAPLFTVGILLALLPAFRWLAVVAGRVFERSPRESRAA